MSKPKKDRENNRYKIPVSVQLLIIENNKVLLMRRKNTGYQDGFYCLPGGHVEEDEEMRIAMIREAKEEIGIEIQKEELEVYKVINRKIENGEYIDFIFKPKKWLGNITNREEEKCDQIIWADIKEIPANTLPFINEIIENKESFYIPYNWN